MNNIHTTKSTAQTEELDVSTKMKVKCPVCGSSLPDEQYNLATRTLNEKLMTMTQEQFGAEITRFGEEKSELARKHESELEHLRIHQETQLKYMEEDLKKSYNLQVDSVRRTYSDSEARHLEDLKKLEFELSGSFEQKINDKNAMIKSLEEQKKDYKKRAQEEARVTAEQETYELRKEILQRDVQLSRFKEEVELLKKQVSQSQAELKGEAGEIDLFVKLTEAFPDDQFRRQTRGKSTGDVIQQIRTNTGTIDMPIVYDNKEAENISQSDIVKAKKYRQIHGTRYVIIVSTKLPKRDVKSGLLGDREGIYLVHPTVLMPFVKYLREAIIEMSLMSKSERDRDLKESILYSYIRSQEFTNRLEQISRIHEKACIYISISAV